MDTERHDLHEMRSVAIKHLTLYCNEKMWHEMGVAMPEFSKTQCTALVDIIDKAIAHTKNDPISRVLLDSLISKVME